MEKTPSKNTRLHVWFNQGSHLRIILILIIVCLCIAEITSLWNAVRPVNQQKAPVNLALLDASHPDPSAIASWMTFDYINTIFKLPSTYLEATFAISDPLYPNISLGRYARQHGLNEIQFLTNIEHAVSTYAGDK